MRRSPVILLLPLLLLVVAGCSGINAGTVGPTPAATAGHQPAGEVQAQTHSIPRQAPAGTVTHGPRSKREVALTFDADFSPFALRHVNEHRYPEQVNTAVLDYLQQHAIPATIFVTGMWARQYPDALARVAASPQLELANHTWNHDAWTSDCYNLPHIDNDGGKHDQIRRTQRLLLESTGVQPRWFRFPGLCHTKNDERIVAAEGLQPVDTDVAVDDAFARDATRAVAAMLTQIKPGSILLLHLNGAPNAPATAQILSQLVPALAQRKLTPVTLTQLLGSE